jgi:hypothetical protein
MFSIAQSRFTIPSQAIFFILNAVGLFLGTVYNANTPDLYENNAHHKMGWIFTWMAAAWVIMGIVKIYGDYMKRRRNSRQQISQANLARYARLQQQLLFLAPLLHQAQSSRTKISMNRSGHTMTLISVMIQARLRSIVSCRTHA